MAQPTTADERERDWFIEQVGLASEADGFTHIAGRLFGLLLLSSTPCSLDEMADVLNVSKASVSTEARRLLERNVVLRQTVEGDRRDYYQIAPDFFRAVMQTRVNRWSRMHDLAVAARERMPELPPAVRERLSYVDIVHDFLIDRMNSALLQWDERVSLLAPEQSRKTAGKRTSRRPSSD
jgi:DNA-binding transcriptional regulator GbsR (MarR family)